MAARKKARGKRKTRPARKVASRKRRAKPRKKAPVKKATAPRRAPPRPPATPPPAPVARAAPVAPAAISQVPAAERAPAANEYRVGTVTHYFGHISVAVVQLESGTLRVGDTIRVLGHTTDFRQRVTSLQIEHQPVSEVAAGEFGVKVSGQVREHDIVYKVG